MIALYWEQARDGHAVLQAGKVPELAKTVVISEHDTVQAARAAYRKMHAARGLLRVWLPPGHEWLDMPTRRWRQRADALR